jgi:hypothetical protein
MRKECVFFNLNKVNKLVSLTVIITMMFFILLSRTMETEYRENDNLIALKETQQWALRNTNSNSYFLVDNIHIYGGWTNGSKRPSISYRKTGSPYMWSTYADSFNKKVTGYAKEYKLYEASGEVDETNEIISFGEFFEIDYVVWKTEWYPLQLEEVYQNEFFIIYKLN